jgi:hypothetical protein
MQTGNTALKPLRLAYDVAWRALRQTFSVDLGVRHSLGSSSRLGFVDLHNGFAVGEAGNVPEGLRRVLCGGGLDAANDVKPSNAISRKAGAVPSGPGTPRKT